MFENTTPAQDGFDAFTAEKPVLRSSKISYFGQLAILIGFAGMGIVVSSVLAVIIWMMMTHQSFTSMATDILLPAYANAAKLIQLVMSFCMFFLPAYFLSLLLSRKPLQYMQYNRKVNIRQVYLVIAMVFAGLFLSGALTQLNQIIPIPHKWEVSFKAMEKAYTDGVKGMASMKNFGDYLYTLFVIAIAPAIFEETFFRGGLQNILVKWTKNAAVGIIITSIIFSAAHTSYYGFLPRFGLGIILGYIYYYGKNIWLNILLHFLNNGFAVTMLYFATKNGQLKEDALDDTTFPWYIGIAAVIALVALFKYFKQVTPTQQSLV
ncbi:CPBP family intramembrane glutamic endopeptidase [Hydrotalea sp.]|uniref:CPBP family intramembrane glutamic endopeptidase n=1 Tax=Hydrotalea sp. TaxID=2881279 RepID=UPI0025825DDD|nr:CPBP family intramembrane glutamic endopeptidase [Hydrotalea sp.]